MDTNTKFLRKLARTVVPYYMETNFPDIPIESEKYKKEMEKAEKLCNVELKNYEMGYTTFSESVWVISHLNEYTVYSAK